MNILSLIIDLSRRGDQSTTDTPISDTRKEKLTNSHSNHGNSEQEIQSMPVTARNLNNVQSDQAMNKISLDSDQASDTMPFDVLAADHADIVHTTGNISADINS